MKILSIYAPPSPTIRGQQEGCGESVCYNNKIYCYTRAGKTIPTNKVALLKYEGGFAGRVNGEKDWLIVCYNENNEIVVLESPFQSPMIEMKKYKGLTNAQAIDMAQKEEARIKAIVDAYDKCRDCGKSTIVLAEGQPKDQCYTCFTQKK